MFANATSKSISKIAAGVVVAVPSMALVQGVYFVTQFRHRHRDASFPISPSKGLVYVKAQHEDSKKFEKSRMWSWSNFKHRTINTMTRIDQEKKPLRLLVIGDSLAAGVGSSSAISPLPESIAKTLSKKLDKPVFWICHGIPGAATSTILEQFTLMKLTDRVKRFIAIKSMNRWNDFLLFEKNLLQDRLNITKPLPRIMQREKRYDRDIDHDDTERETSWKRIEDTMIKSQEGYDVVIVLTGVNDLKGIFLPFLQDEVGSNKHTFKEDLKRLLVTISPRMESRSGNDETKVALICLPALPTIPQVFHYPPLCWFVQSLLQMMDDDKRSLAEEFPNVLFVESPNKETINESQPQRNDGKVIYSFTNISTKMKESIEILMEKYLSKNEVDENYQVTESFYEASEHGGLVISSLAEDEELVALNGVHPSDFGYILWFNFIANHIAERMVEY